MKQRMWLIKEMRKRRKRRRKKKKKRIKNKKMKRRRKKIVIDWRKKRRERKNKSKQRRKFSKKQKDKTNLKTRELIRDNEMKILLKNLKIPLNYLPLLIAKILVIVMINLILGIFDKQSSATLQKTILVYSIPKAQRFSSGPKYAG